MAGLAASRALILALASIVASAGSAAAQIPDCKAFARCPEVAACNARVLEALNRVPNRDPGGLLTHVLFIFQQAQQEQLRASLSPQQCDFWTGFPLSGDQESATLLAGTWEGVQATLEGSGAKTVVLSVEEYANAPVKAVYEGRTATGTFAGGVLTLDVERPEKQPNEFAYVLHLQRAGWQDIDGRLYLRRDDGPPSVVGYVRLSKTKAPARLAPLGAIPPVPPPVFVRPLVEFGPSLSGGDAP
jgi:hypothetical protein